MKQNEYNFQQWAAEDVDHIDFDELESKLESELVEQMDDLKGLELDQEKIGNPDSIGNTVKNVVWEQFINQIGVIAGEDFIKENRDMTLDLRDDAHIQTTENFAEGKIATHNDKIDYKKRHDEWKLNFQHDENGNVITHSTRTGKEETTLVPGARKPYDIGRPTGSVGKGTDVDHIVPAGEIIRDPVAGAHMTKEEKIDFANSPVNLNEMPADQNRSKGDKSMEVWLKNPNKNGQKPDEIFDISKKQYDDYIKKDENARAEYEKQKQEGEQRSIEAGKQSQKEEFFRIGGKALRSVVMGLLAELVKEIIRKLVAWFRSGKRKLGTFIDSVKKAIKSFISNLKKHLLTAGDTLITTITTAIVGPVVGVIKKAWIFLKQGFKSVQKAIAFLKDPANKNMPFSLKMMNIGKIVIAGLAAGGAIVLSEVIEKGLMTIPVFAFQIPLLGSLASLLGIFLGALVSGLVGALALNIIDRLISKKLKKINEVQQIDKRNDIIATQDKLIIVKEHKLEKTIETVSSNIKNRHKVASESIRHSLKRIMRNNEEISVENAEIIEDETINKSENSDILDNIESSLDKIKK